VQDESEMDAIDKALAIIKPKRVDDGYAEEDKNAQADFFVKKMDEAYDKDVMAVRQGQPAFNKLKFLQEVNSQCRKSGMRHRLLDHRLLAAFNRWLSFTVDESTGTKVLPNQRLRTQLVDLLDILPVSEHSLESSGGLGRTLATIVQHKDETATNKKKIRKLIEKWCRPINSKAVDYRKLADHEFERRKTITARKTHINPHKVKYNSAKRAMIPTAVHMDFAVRPVGKEMSQEQRQRAERLKTQNKSELEKSLSRKEGKVQPKAIMAAVVARRQ
jgi:hypothetical protein